MHRLTRNLRTLVFLLIVSAVLTALGVLWWANHTGMPASWRSAVEQEIAKQGVYVKIGSLSYVPLRGVIAADVHVFSEPLRLREISRLERVILDFDKTKLASGSLQINKIELSHATLQLPIDPQNQASATLDVTDANGTIFMPGDRHFEVRDAHGKIAGIDVTFNSRIIGYREDRKQPAEDPNIGKRRELLAQIIKELGLWRFNEGQPPAIQISVEGDVNDRASITAKLALQVKDMAKNGHKLDGLTAAADLTGDLLTVTMLRATDRRGVFEGHMDYDIQGREGRFDVSSSLEVPRLLTAWLGLPAIQEVAIRGRQILEAEGDFTVDGANVPQLRMTGHIRCEGLTLREIPFSAVQGAFAWRDGSLFIRDLRLTRPDGEAKGKAMIEWPLVRLALHSTLPVSVYRPFFIGQPLELVLNDMTERDGAAVDVTLEGGFDADNKTAWAYTGSGTAKNLNYKGVPVNSADCKFSLNHQELDFYEGTVVFNYSKYALHKAFNGPEEGTAKVGRIRYDAPSKTVEVEDVRGLFWAAPMVRLFAPNVADTLEQYRFHHPPELKGAGVVDTTPQGRTVLNVAFSSDHPADYQFLGENLTLGQPRAQVTIHGERVTISNLKLEAFDGPVDAHIEYLGGGKLAGEVSWTKLSIPALSSAYGFQMKCGGNVTGRLEFSLADGKVETMNGEGLLAVEKAELFAVPMFGPLTPLIGGVLNNDKVGFQHAKNAFCTFKIQNGILTSNDFQTSTTSLNFAGNGSVDMKAQTMDMTMRMNARGLLGIITLPLRPFTGLFQFQGTGPLKDTKWESMKFTSPPETQNEILLAPPKAKIIGSGE